MNITIHYSKYHNLSRTCDSKLPLQSPTNQPSHFGWEVGNCNTFAVTTTRFAIATSPGARCLAVSRVEGADRLASDKEGPSRPHYSPPASFLHASCVQPSSQTSYDGGRGGGPACLGVCSGLCRRGDRKFQIQHFFIVRLMKFP